MVNAYVSEEEKKGTMAHENAGVLEVNGEVLEVF